MNAFELKYTQSIYGVLAVLSAGPQSGYDIRKALDHPEMFYWRESYGNIYPMLNKLLQDGLVEKTDTSIKKRKRLMYKLNEKGWKELRNWLEEPANLGRFRVEILMKLRFGEGSGVKNMISQLVNYKKQCEDQMGEAEHLLEQISNSGESLINDIRKITINLFIGRKMTTLDWCTESIDILRKWEIIEENQQRTKKVDSCSNTSNFYTDSGINHEEFSPVTANSASSLNRIIPLME